MADAANENKTPAQVWLDTLTQRRRPISHGGPVPADYQFTNGELLALLVAKNGFDIVVHGWGVFQGNYGLEMYDALALIEMSAFLSGIYVGMGMDADQRSGAVFAALDPILKEIHDRWEAETKGEKA